MYLALSQYLRERYGAPTYRLTLAGGRTCPTRDGTFGPKKGWGGCTFCDAYGSASFFAEQRKELTIQEQLETAAAGIRRRFGAEKFVAYFQSYTTSHKEVEEYRARFATAVNFPDVVALAVATRPDCLPESFLELVLEQLARVDVILELGVQTFHNPTLEWFDRGHDAECSRQAIRWAKTEAEKIREQGARGRFDLVAHMILGSPLEKEADVIRGAEELNALGVQGVKIHHLHILKGTKLAREYAKHPFPLPSLDEYNRLLALFLRHLDPKIVVHRTHGAAPRQNELIAPEWTQSGAFPNSLLRNYMNASGFKQGDLAR